MWAPMLKLSAVTLTVCWRLPHQQALHLKGRKFQVVSVRLLVRLNVFASTQKRLSHAIALLALNNGQMKKVLTKLLHRLASLEFADLVLLKFWVRCTCLELFPKMVKSTAKKPVCLLVSKKMVVPSDIVCLTMLLLHRMMSGPSNWQRQPFMQVSVF